MRRNLPFCAVEGAELTNVISTPTVMHMGDLCLQCLFSLLLVFSRVSSRHSTLDPRLHFPSEPI